MKKIIAREGLIFLSCYLLMFVYPLFILLYPIIQITRFVIWAIKTLKDG